MTVDDFLTITAEELRPGMYLCLLGWHEVVSVEGHGRPDYVLVTFANADGSRSRTAFARDKPVRVRRQAYEF